jgi:LPS-assembly protein
LDFFTVSGAFRTPLGWTIGAKSYYDVRTGNSPELDVVGLYQNPCKCWSLGLYYIKFPDRMQYNFLLSLTGLGGTESLGTEIIKSILSPILQGERGVPWPTAFARRPATPGAQPASANP